MNNIRIVEAVARTTGFTLTGFYTDEHLELYFDVEQAGISMCFVAKGWNDPGFRIGAVISTPLPSYVVRDIPFRLMDLCSIQGVAISYNGDLSTRTWMLDAVIYHGGFTNDAFHGTVTAVADCSHAVQMAIESSGFRYVFEAPSRMR